MSELIIELTTNESDLTYCARLMSESEPFASLKIDFEKSQLAMRGDYKEVYLAKVDNVIAGFVVVQFYGVLRGYIQTICVVPDYRRKGIGSALLKFSEETLLKRFPNVFLCVTSYNHEAQKLYYRLGYEKVGELKDHIIKGADEYILRKQGCPISEFVYSYDIHKTKVLTTKQFKQINQLWNEEYPKNLKDRFPILLEGVNNYNHYIIDDPNKNVIAWAVDFEKDKQVRFSIIVSSINKGKGFGGKLIAKLKEENEEFYGWVIDHNNDLKLNGSPYQTPMPFYLKHNFEILNDSRIDTEMIKAVLIKWKNESNN